MKRFALIVLAALLLFALAACGGGEPAAESGSTAEPDRTEAHRTDALTEPVQAETETEPGGSEAHEPVVSFPYPEAPEGTTTLMVYMLGSDLEPKSAAGSQDLQEMAESGVDLSTANVVVFAGGSPKWHNELTDSSVGSVLRLTEDCFECVETRDPVSMGDPETLAWFLDYCVREVPADHYALILWDHGSGPVIGYGKDMLFQGDGLTLAEMRQAMEASPFGPDNKLDWVGFDACLMASAELACVWSDYTDFLIASQEVEPAFGWNYSFLDEFGKADVLSLSDRLTADYRAACLDYFAAKGFADRDTTLACLDLRYAPLLEEALNDLFGKAAAELETCYDRLTAERVNTRALGRASTGSEYDLVDLGDLAEQLAPLFPKESGLLGEIVRRMVPVNAVNSGELHGMSLYFPFYNKRYYENGWADAYRELGVLKNYCGFLTQYEQTWLSDGMLDTYAPGVTPSMISDGVYTLELTDEQAAHFAKARYLITRRNAGDNYTVLATGSEVEFDGKTLTAHFDGSVLYAANKVTGEATIPFYKEFDTVGGLTRCQVELYMGNVEDDLSFPQKCQIRLSGNKATGEVGVTAFVDAGDEDVLAEGKAEDLEPTDWSAYILYEIPPHVLTRTDSGLIRGVIDWKTERVLTYLRVPTLDGLEFYYAPLPSGEFSVFLEITDTQGSVYCSEPLDVRHRQTASGRTAEEKPAIELSLGGGETKTVYDKDGLRLSVRREDDDSGIERVSFRLENNGSDPVRLALDNLRYNGNVSTSGSVLLQAEPGESSDWRSLSFGKGADTGLVTEAERLRLMVSISDLVSERTILYGQPVQIELDGPVKLEPYYSDDISTYSPFLGWVAQEQTVYEDENMRLKVWCLGSDRYQSLNLVYSIENLSGEQIRLSLTGLAFDDNYVDVYQVNRVPAGAIVYDRVNCRFEQRYAQVSSLSRLQLVFSLSSYYSRSDPVWCEIRLSEPMFQKTEIFRQGGVRIYLAEYEKTSYAHIWYLLAENDSDLSISIGRIDCMADTASGPVEDTRSWMTMRLGPHQVTESTLNCFTDDFEGLTALRFRFVIQNFAGNTILETGSEEITLKAE